MYNIFQEMRDREAIHRQIEAEKVHDAKILASLSPAALKLSRDAMMFIDLECLGFDGDSGRTVKELIDRHYVKTKEAARAFEDAVVQGYKPHNIALFLVMNTACSYLSLGKGNTFRGVLTETGKYILDGWRNCAEKLIKNGVFERSQKDTVERDIIKSIREKGDIEQEPGLLSKTIRWCKYGDYRGYQRKTMSGAFPGDPKFVLSEYNPMHSFGGKPLSRAEKSLIQNAPLISQIWYEMRFNPLKPSSVDVSRNDFIQSAAWLTLLGLPFVCAGSQKEDIETYAKIINALGVRDGEGSQQDYNIYRMATACAIYRRLYLARRDASRTLIPASGAYVSVIKKARDVLGKVDGKCKDLEYYFPYDEIKTFFASAFEREPYSETGEKIYCFTYKHMIIIEGWKQQPHVSANPFHFIMPQEVFRRVFGG